MVRLYKSPIYSLCFFEPIYRIDVATHHHAGIHIVGRRNKNRSVCVCLALNDPVQSEICLDSAFFELQTPELLQNVVSGADSLKYYPASTRKFTQSNFEDSRKNADWPTSEVYQR